MDAPQLSRLEGRTYRAALDDGLWDILLGTWLLSIGVGTWVGPRWLPLIVGINAMMIWRVIRRSVTEPRVGYVRLSADRVAKLRRGQCVVGIAAGVLLVALLLPEFVGSDSSRQAWRDVPGVVKAATLLSIPIGLAAYVFEIPRLYIYASTIAISTAAVLAAGARWEWMLIASGAAAALSGAVVLGKFMRRYPAAGQGA